MFHRAGGGEGGRKGFCRGPTPACTRAPHTACLPATAWPPMLPHLLPAPTSSSGHTRTWRLASLPAAGRGAWRITRRHAVADAFTTATTACQGQLPRHLLALSGGRLYMTALPSSLPSF